MWEPTEKPLKYLYTLLCPALVSFPVSNPVPRYLEQSILALDVSNKVTKSHMSPVLNGLAHHLTGLEKSLQSNPGCSGLARQVWRLRLVAEQLRKPYGQ